MCRPTAPRFLYASILAIGLGLAGGAADAQTITIGLQQEPTSLDPTADATASIDGMLTQNVYESLTSVDSSGTPIPQLAESWTISDDGLTYVFSLVEGATFHDSTPFDAEIAKYSFDRAMAEDSVNPTKAIFAPIESVTVVDPQTLEIKLSRRDAFFLFNLAQGDASMVTPDTADTNRTSPNGTGPFRFDGWTRGDRLTLVKNPDHRNADSVQLERVVFRFIAEPAAASAALLAEEIDAYPGFPAPELLVQFEADPRFNVTVGSTEGEVILTLNNGRPPFDNLDVRRAINTALDRNAIIEGAMYGRALPIGSFYPPHGPAYVDLTGTYPYDPAQAREMFEAAGVAGSTMTMRVPPFPYATRSAEIIQAQLSEAGIDARVEIVEWGFWLDEVYGKHNYEMTIIAQTSPNDMGNFARGPSYYFGYDNPEYTALWNRIREEADADTRNELLKEGQRMLADDAVHFFMFQLPLLGVFRTGIEGFWPSQPVQFQPLAGVTVGN